MLKQDLRRAVGSLGMLLALGIGLVLLLEPVFHVLFPMGGRHSAGAKDDYINLFFSSLALGGYLIFTPLISVLPAVVPFCDEINTGYYQFVVVRKGRARYLFSRWLSNAMAGGLATAGPLVLLAGIALLRCEPYTQQMMDEGSFSPLHSSIFAPFETVGGGLLVVGILVGLAFLFGAVWSTVGLGVAAWIPNRYVGLCAPFVLFFFLHLVCSFLHLETFSPVNTILPDILPSFAFLAVYQLILMAAATLVYGLGANRRLTA